MMLQESKKEMKPKLLKKYKLLKGKTTFYGFKSFKDIAFFLNTISKEIIDEYSKHLTENNEYGYINIILQIDKCLKLLGAKNEKS
jgi:hypothetical protein